MQPKTNKWILITALAVSGGLLWLRSGSSGVGHKVEIAPVKSAGGAAETAATSSATAVAVKSNSKNVDSGTKTNETGRTADVVLGEATGGSTTAAVNKASSAPQKENIKKTWTVPTREEKRKFLTENKVFR